MSRSPLAALVVAQETSPGSDADERGPDERGPDERGPDDVSRSGARRWLVVAFWIVVGIELVWLIAANAFLRTDLARDLATRKPDKVQIQWDSAWSLVPGVVHLRGFELRVRGSKATWALDIDRGWCVVSVPELLAKRVHVPVTRVGDVAFRLARTAHDEPASDGAASDDAASDDAAPRFPEFEGRPEPDRKRPKKPWRWIFDSVEIDGVSELWIDAIRYLPHEVGGTVRGGVRVVPRDSTTLPSLSFDLPRGALHLGDERIGGVERASFDGRIDRFRHGSGAGGGKTAWLRQLHGVLRAGVADATLAPLEHYFRGLPVGLDGSGDVDFELHLDGGEVTPPSRVQVEEASVEVAYAEVRVEGEGRLDARVLPTGAPLVSAETNAPTGSDGADTAPEPTKDADSVADSSRPRADLEMTLDHFELRRAGSDGAHVRGDRLVLVGSTPTLDLLDPEPELRARVTIDDAEIPDVRYYNAYLPPSSPVTLTSGAGRLDLEAFFSSLERKASADVALRGSDVGARWRDVDLRGDLSVEATMPEGDLRGETFRDVDATVVLTDARVDGEAVDEGRGGWSMRARAAVDEIELQQPVTLRAAITATCTNSRPFVAFIGARSRVVDWLSDTLTVEDLDLAGDLRLSGQSLALRDLSVTGGENNKLEIDAELRFGGGSRDGIMLLQWGRLSAGVELEGDEKSWELFGSRKWYERRAKSFW